MTNKTTKIKYSPREIVEIEGIVVYGTTLFIIDIISSTIQILADIKPVDVLKTFIPYLICSYIAFIIYRRKKKKLKTIKLEWLVAFLSNFLVIFARYNYAYKYDWQYAVEAFHIYGIALSLLILLQFLYNKKIYMTFYILHIINWITFLVLAKYIGNIEMPFSGFSENGEIYHGILLSRQIYFILMLIIIGFFSYRSIPIINRYDERTKKQRNKILFHSKKQHEMSIAVEENARDLFSKMDEQNKQLQIFNEKLQNQAATFEEISSTIEELLASSDEISEVAVSLAKANSTINFTMNEFFEIKKETKNKLNDSLEGIAIVVTQSNMGYGILEEVEQTIFDLKDQSEKILSSISVIVEIADKINLLSLNASIEAARAGEHGRGFAVVADEVGKLASMTGDSISEIHSVLSDSKQKTDSSVKIIKEAAENVKLMIDQMLESSQKIDALRDNIFLEEKFLQGINEQMKQNIELSEKTDEGTSQMKDSLELSAVAIENLNNELSVMVEGINKMTRSSQLLSENAKLLTEKTKEGAIGLEDDDI